MNIKIQTRSFRLLARLWEKIGGRESQRLRLQIGTRQYVLRKGYEAINLDPGKQVTVMRRAVAAIREMNEEESAMETRTDSYRRPDFAKDPRATKSMTFESTVERNAKRRENGYRFWKDDEGNKVDNESLIRRREGHIEMSTNHRTLPQLMNTMNTIFQDTFE